MQEQISQFRQHVTEASGSPKFVHHKWFVKWHLEIVDRLAKELLEFYPHADKELVEVLVWLHDYGKILNNYDDQYEQTKKAGRQKLAAIGFPPEFVDKAVQYADILDQKMEVDLRQAPIEVQIVSTADGCSHMTGPFMKIFWHFPTEKTFEGKTFEELMKLNIGKLDKSWNRKMIVLPEARKAFEARYKLLKEQSGVLPERFF
jgi:HD domain-containing protein